MKGKRYTEEQIIGILKEHESGVPAQEVIRKHGIASGTFYRWKSKYGGITGPHGSLNYQTPRSIVSVR